MGKKSMLLFILFLGATGLTILYGLTVGALYFTGNQVGLEIIIGLVMEILASIVVYHMYRKAKYAI